MLCYALLFTHLCLFLMMAVNPLHLSVLKLPPSLPLCVCLTACTITDSTVSAD